MTISRMRKLGPGGPLPVWNKDANKTRLFQDWANLNYSTTSKDGLNRYDALTSDGKFGPKTTAAWNKYGTEFTKAQTLGQQQQAGQSFRAGLPGIRIDDTGPKVTTAPYQRPDLPELPDRTSYTPSTLDKGIAAANELAPFATNIVNAFRRPPMPNRGVANPYVTLNKVNLDGERQAVNRDIEAANRNTERNIDANSAEAIKAFNRGTKFERLSAISDKETNANVQIGSTQAQLDAATAAANNEKTDEYNRSLVERRMAQQREQSGNLANAGDKLMMIRNEREKGRVELQKANVLATGLYGKSGVLDRVRRRLKDDGQTDPLGKDFTDLKAYGGMLRPMPRKKMNC